MEAASVRLMLGCEGSRFIVVLQAVARARVPRVFESPDACPDWMVEWASCERYFDWQPLMWVPIGAKRDDGKARPF